MTRAPSDDADIGLLREVPGRVVRAGYVDLYLAYRGLPIDPRALRRELAELAPELVGLVRLFALGEAVEPAALEPVLGRDCLVALERLSVFLRDDGGRLHTGGMSLLPLLGRLVFLPAMRHSPAALFGDDTLALAFRLAPPPGARCLNLHAGAGALALHAASLAAHVVAIEDNPLARACAELNVIMNGLDGRVEVRAGTGADPVGAGERFDHVAANPPLLPFPPELFGPVEADAGGGLTERVLRLVPDLLGETGLAQVVGTDLGDAGGPRLARLLEAQAREHGLAVALAVTSQVRLDQASRMLGALADNSARAGVLSAAEARRRMLAHLERTRCDRVFLFHLTAGRGQRGALSVSRPDRYGGGYWSR